MEFIDALDLQRLGADAVDLRAHCDEAVAQVDDLRLARGILDPARSLRGDGGHDDILGRADRYDREGIAPTQQPPARRRRSDVTRAHLQRGADRLQRLEVQVDRPVADRATTRQRHARLPRPREDRAQHQDRRAHLAHDVIGRLGGGQHAGTDRHHTTEFIRSRSFDAGRRAELVEQMSEPVDIGQPGQVAQRHRLVGQERARHQRERRVLRAGNGELAGKAVAATDQDTVHRNPLSNRAPIAKRAHHDRPTRPPARSDDPIDRL